MGNVKLDEDCRDINADRMYFYERKGDELVIYEPEETFDSADMSTNTHKKIEKAGAVEKSSHSMEDNKKQISNYSDNNKRASVIKKTKKYEDEILYCNVCGKGFTFSDNDQKEYDKKGWLYPNRCPKCERRKYLPTWIQI